MSGSLGRRFGSILEAFGVHFGDLFRSWGALGRQMAPKSKKARFSAPFPGERPHTKLIKNRDFLVFFVLF